MDDNDRCPDCGAPIEFDEVDIGVGEMKGNPHCPECGWFQLPFTQLSEHDDDKTSGNS